MKNSLNFIISGSILDQKTQKGIPGLRVEAWDRDFIQHDFLGSARTNENGIFKIAFNSSHFRELHLDKHPDVFFRIFSGQTLLKNTIHDLICNLKPGRQSITIYLPDSGGNDELTPPDSEAEAFSGPLVDPENLFSFKRTLSGVLAGFGSKYSQDAIQSIHIPFEGVSGLMDLATGAISGDQEQQKRLRELLWSYGGKKYPTRLGIKVLQQYRNGEYCGPAGLTSQPPANANQLSDAPQLVDMYRLEQLMIAAAFSARDTKELATLAAGIQLALGGVDQLNTLFGLLLNQADPIDIAGAFDTAVRTSGFSSWPPFDGFTPGEGGWPIPGSGFGPGVPWFEWPYPNPGDPFPFPGDPTPGDPIPDVPVPEIPQFDPGLTEHFESCFLFRIIPELHRTGLGFRDLIYGVGTNYIIESVSPDHACPGTTITLEGERFDGTVAVRYKDNRGHTISTPPASVSSTRVTFELAENAVSGPVWLYIPRTVRLCLTEHTVAIPGVAGDLIVGHPHIISFGAVSSCYPVGETITLNWRVSPNNVDVRIRHFFGGATSTLITGADAVSGITFTPTSTGVHEFEIQAINNEASSACFSETQTITVEVGDPPPPPFEIVGVEITQAIQVYDLADPTAATNNSVPLIAEMDTVLRVYVRRLSPVLTRVTGNVEINGVIYDPINADMVGPNPIIAAVANPDRTVTNDSLNFLIPAADATGLGVTAHIRIFSATNPCVNPIQYRAETLDWVERTPFPVTVRIVANSDGSQLTLAEATNRINAAFFKMPSPKSAISFHPGVHQIRRGTTEDNYCHDGGFYQLALSIAYEHNDNEGYPPASHSSSWIGIVTPRNCTPDGMMAWPSTSTCLSIQDITTMAHELMHTAGLGHTITNAGEGCWEGPAFTGGADTQPVACHRLDGRPMGQLIQVPFDILNNTAVTNAFDLMSYRGWDRRWLSPELWIEGRAMMDSRY